MHALDPKRSSHDEAARIFGAVFGGAPSPVVVERFIAASDRLNENAGAEEVARYYAALGRVGDLEALEIAARVRRRLRLLVSKFRVMVYIAETVPENQRYLVNRRTNRAGAIWALAGGAVRTAYKFAKGLVLLRRVTRA